MLKTVRDFLGREDTTLKARLLSELPGILNWALDGWERLQKRGHFIQPESARDEVEALANGSNPVPRFVEDECAVDDEYTVDGDDESPKLKVWTLKDDLYRAYRRWCEDQKEPKPFGSDTFFRKLKETHPNLRDYRPRKAGDKRARYVMGIALLTEEEKADRLKNEETPHAA